MALGVRRDGFVRDRADRLGRQMTFDGTQSVIGRGAQAEVLLYHGFAYKVYKASYPAEWIAFEKEQQRAVNGAGLCPVRYYDTDDSHTIRMDFVDGVTLEKRMRDLTEADEAGSPEHVLVASPADGFRLLAEAFRFVHQADSEGTAIPQLADTAGMGMSEADRTAVLQLIGRLSEKFPSCICHLDLHFLNIMLVNGGRGYVIIDWMNARRAPPVFDYARSYVIFDEFAKDAVGIYKAAVLPDLQELGISESDFADAVSVCSVIRKYERAAC